jgi:broad specificity phosphatase PhoE
MTNGKPNDLDWVEKVQTIMTWVQSLGHDESLMLLLRHSHREILKDHNDMLAGGLTELGKATSKDVGKLIPTIRRAHFFFSVVPRCYETAEAMAQGFTEMGGEVIDMDPLPCLVGPEYKEQDVWKHLNPNGENVTEFVNRWAEGGFGDAIEPLEDYQNRIMNDTVERIASLSEALTHVHITHDLGLMCTKRLLLGRPLEDRDREPYLGGFAVAIGRKGRTLFIDQEEKPM